MNNAVFRRCDERQANTSKTGDCLPLCKRTNTRVSIDCQRPFVNGAQVLVSRLCGSPGAKKGVHFSPSLCLDGEVAQHHHLIGGVAGRCREAAPDDQSPEVVPFDDVAPGPATKSYKRTLKFFGGRFRGVRWRSMSLENRCCVSWKFTHTLNCARMPSFTSCQTFVKPPTSTKPIATTMIRANIMTIAWNVSV